jgi:hypothetical protein
MSIKKAVSCELNPGDKTSFEKTGRLLDGNPHYIDLFMGMNPPRDYRPPMIIGQKGTQYKLRHNENQVIENNDMVVPSFFIKVYDALDYGARALYCCVRIVRLVKDDERDSSTVDYSAWAEDFDEEQVMSRIAKRKAEAFGGPESGGAKKPNPAEEEPSDRGTKRKTGSPKPAEPKKQRSETPEEVRDRLLREEFEAGMDQ